MLTELLESAVYCYRSKEIERFKARIKHQGCFKGSAWMHNEYASEHVAAKFTTQVKREECRFLDMELKSTYLGIAVRIIQTFFSRWRWWNGAQTIIFMREINLQREQTTVELLKTRFSWAIFCVFSAHKDSHS